MMLVRRRAEKSWPIATSETSTHPPGTEHSGGRYQVFQASRYIRTGVELRQAIEELRVTRRPGDPR